MVFVKSSRFKWVSATLVIPSERRIAMHHLDLSNALQPNAVKLSIVIIQYKRSKTAEAVALQVYKQLSLNLMALPCSPLNY